MKLNLRSGVELPVSPNYSFRPIRNCKRWLLLAIFAALPAAVCLADAEPQPVKLDELVYKDGDRVRGHLVSRDEQMILFESARFGLLRVPATDAKVMLANPQPSASGPAPAAPEFDNEAEWLLAELSPRALARSLKEFFGPWHGRVAFSTELVAETNNSNIVSLDTNLKRKWTSDEVQLTARYDYNDTNNVVTTDTVKALGSWRHDFNKWRFAQYVTTLEWDQASKLNGLPNDYVLLQQEVGVGFNLLVKPTRKIRVGVAADLFDIWNSAPTPAHNSRAATSVFEEVDFTLPWRMTLSQRGVGYLVPGRPAGWENRVELNKKLTETFSVSIKDEIRRNSPDGSAQNYSRLKLLFGLDF